MHRIIEALERAAVWGRRVASHAWTVARDPLRILPIMAVAALLVIGIPYTITGLSRVARSTMNWRSESSVEWRRTEGTVVGVRETGTVEVRVRFRDRSGRIHVAEAPVIDPSTWITPRVPIRFDAAHPDRVELVGYGTTGTFRSLLIAGAPLGVGVGSLILAIGLWRRRRLVAVSASPIAVLRRPLAAAGVAVLAGVGAWTVGTVLERGWSAIVSASGHLAAQVFGDLLGVLVPLVAFAAGALLTAWLARHRHHEVHGGMLSRAHRLIDRAAGYVPSPEELGPDPGRVDGADRGDDVPVPK